MSEDLKNWQSRRNSYIKWRQEHRVKNIKIGDRIDVRDTEYIWCSGAVEKILRSKYNCADLYYVHYDGWSRCYDEYIPADSDRIAPLKFYTSRSDIPKYTRHEGPDERVYGNVVEGGDNDADRNRQPQAERASEQNNDNANNQNEQNNEDEEEADNPANLNLQTEARNEQSSSQGRDCSSQ
jgi:hypothetical protein